MTWLDEALWKFADKWISLWGESGGRTIDVNGDAYLTRLFLTPKGWPFRVFLHHFHRSDQDRDLHNHPWNWAFSLILSGGYVEERRGAPLGEPGQYEVTQHVRLPGTINFLTSDSFHRADLLDKKKGAWTLFVRGKRKQGWGFWNRESGDFVDWSLDETTDD